jgi:predicted amidohydrolase
VRGIKQFAFQPGALRWGALSGNGKLTIIDSKPAPEPAERPLERVLPGGGAAVAFNADATRVAAADARGIVRIWDVATGRLLRTLRLDDRPADTVLVAAVQCSSVFGDPAANRKALAAYVTQAAKAGAKIVVLPETAVTGYLTSDLKRTWQVDQRPLSPGLEGADPAMAAETVPGSSTEFFSQIADRCGIYLTVPLLEVDRRTGRYYNTVVLLGPDGRTLIHYRKRNPWMWAEQGWVTAGDLGNPVVDTPFGRLGLLVCFDIHEQAAVMAERKIDTLLYSIAWVEEQGSPWFANTLPAIARERGFHIVAANWTVPRGQRPTWFGYGQSRIISKEGGVLARAGKDTDEGVVFAEIPCGDQTGVPPP